MEKAEEVVLKVERIHKDFILPHEIKNSLKEKIIRFSKPKHEIFHALKDVNFEVKKGEFFGIVGRNGSGKSSLLKIIGGIYQPTKGKVTINGTLTPFIELGIGFNPELTGRDNVFLNGAILGLTRKEITAKYEEIVRFAELEKFMDQKLKNYSSGMQVRLAFSIAIQAHNDILLIDEVLAVGDQIFQEKCFDEFARIKEGPKTVIFVSHDLTAVERFCDRAMILNNGEMVDIGPAKEMVLRYSGLLADEQYDQEARKKKPTFNDDLGTGNITVKKVELISNNKVLKYLKEGQKFIIRTHYEVHQPDPGGYVFGVSVLDHNNISLIAPNTSENNFKIPKLPKSGYIDAAFSFNPLSAGRYSINVAFYSAIQTTAHSYRRGVLKFKVVGKGRHGVFAIEPQWDVQTK